MNKSKLVIGVFCLLIIVVFVPFMSACSSDSTAESKTLKIGAVLSLTGPAAPGNIPIMEGVKLAAEWVNEEGGITVKGQKYLIEILGEDDKTSPQDALAAANKLIFQDNIDFMIAPLLPVLNMAIAQICEENKVLRLKTSGIGGPTEINPDMRYSFGSFMCIYNVPPLYDYLTENYPQVKKVAVIGLDDPGVQAGIEADIKEAKAHGLEVVATEVYTVGTEDFYPILTKVLALEPDAIDLTCGEVLWQAGLIKQARELGFTGPMFTMAPTGDMYLLRDIVSREFAYDLMFCDIDVISPDMPQMIKDIGKVVAEKTSSQFRIGHTDGWAALWNMVQAIEKAQSLDPDVVVDTFEKMEKIESPYGDSRMGGQDLFGVNHVINRPMPFSRIVNGEVEFVKFFEP